MLNPLLLTKESTMSDTLKKLLVAASIALVLGGCFDRSESKQGTKANPDDAASIKMKQH